MTTRTIAIASCLTFLTCVPTAAISQTKGDDVSEEQFWKQSQAFMRNPFAKDKSNGRTILLFAVRSKAVAVVLTPEETGLFGKDAKHRGLLMTAYFAGNIQSQLRSGVKRNDRYAGYLHLLQIHRAIQKHDAKYRNEPLDALLKRHKDGKLLAHVIELEKKSPTDVGKLRK